MKLEQYRYNLHAEFLEYSISEESLSQLEEIMHQYKVKKKLKDLGNLQHGGLTLS